MSGTRFAWMPKPRTTGRGVPDHFGGEIQLSPSVATSSCELAGSNPAGQQAQPPAKSAQVVERQVGSVTGAPTRKAESQTPQRSPAQSVIWFQGPPAGLMTYPLACSTTAMGSPASPRRGGGETGRGASPRRRTADRRSRLGPPRQRATRLAVQATRRDRWCGRGGRFGRLFTILIP
jgi:hypothetical protein